ncbi:unnamed protein product [Cylicocyclus nassatus]|uniref:Uncharacterized protein n=1 Tax=Cylicocyclus nassatus TaxID=53992 RepID=A0AA36HEA9_CYLNA|nr:unnamed protein product [Cylicocyclus nassatus]
MDSRCNVAYSGMTRCPVHLDFHRSREIVGSDSVVLLFVMNKPSRLEQKAQSCIDKGEYYEAHQVYRTLYFRMTQQEKYVELLDVLHSGCKKMAEVNQFLGSIDLAELYAETLMKGKIEASEKILDQIAEMIEQFLNPSFRLPSPDAHTKFISTCVKWSQSVAKKRRERKHGLSDLHYVIAKAYINHGNYANARNHMLFADRPEEFASVLKRMSEESGCKTSESELFCAMSVFQLLAMHRVQTSSKLLAAYMSSLDTTAQSTDSRHEILNFLRLLCNALTLHDENLFDHIVGVYRPHLDSDPSYYSYIDRIGHIFFGRPVSRKNDPFGGLFGNILKGVLGERKEEEDDIFSDSDFEPNATGGARSEEDAYETAEESDIADTPQKETPKRLAVDNFDDLD